MLSSRVKTPHVPSRWKTAKTVLLGSALSLFCTSAWASDFDLSQPEVNTFVQQAVQQGLDRNTVVKSLQDAVFQPSIIKAITKPAERRLRWDQYRALFLQPGKIERGADFVQQYLPAMEQAERVYGVPREVIAAIIGVETDYGRNKGNYRVIDALSTLAFRYPQRAEFFRKELLAYLTLTSEQRLDPTRFKGSYAGAMGYPQFMPSSYRAYAVDFTQTGIRDIWNTPEDAIGSVGRYFQAHGWRTGEAVVLPATGPAVPPEGFQYNSVDLPSVDPRLLAEKGIRSTVTLPAGVKVTPLALEIADGQVEYLLGLHNFYVITRYNRSPLYAMAVTSLAKEIQSTLAARQTP